MNTSVSFLFKSKPRSKRLYERAGYHHYPIIITHYGILLFLADRIVSSESLNNPDYCRDTHAEAPPVLGKSPPETHNHLLAHSEACIKRPTDRLSMFT
jgi:hypothetical protein